MTSIPKSKIHQGLEKVEKISQLVDEIECKRLDRIPDRISRHAARIGATIWTMSTFNRLESNRCKLLQLRTDRLVYDCGMVSEDLLKHLMTLDGIGNGIAEVRSVRKNLVSRIEQLMKRSDDLKSRVESRFPLLHKALISKIELLNICTDDGSNQQAKDMQCESKFADKQENLIAMKQSDIGSEKNEEAPLGFDEREQESSDGEESEEDAMTASEKSLRNNLDPRFRYDPNFQTRDLGHAVMIFADLSRTHKEDVNVSFNESERTLTVVGAPQNHVDTHRHPQWWFREEFCINKNLILQQVQVFFDDDILRIIIPRVRRTSTVSRPRWPMNRCGTNFAEYGSRYNPFHSFLGGFSY